MRIITTGVGAGVLLVAGALSFAQFSTGGADAAVSAQGGPACASLAGRDFGTGVEITSASHVDAGSSVPVQGQPKGVTLPAYCRVEGMIDRRKGAGGKEYGIGFALALPDDWNGRFLLQGGGGLNGSVRPPIGDTAAGDRPALTRGFAVASHDSGHKGAVFDASFNTDQRAALDFAEASVRTVAELSKAITASYYGHPVEHSYMAGCSTGGRESMLASQRYPELFDGIVVGAPAMRTGNSNIGVAWTEVQLNQVAPRDADGKPVPGKIFSAADRKVILDGLLEQCDALDGLNDGMISNVAECHFDPSKLQCKPGTSENCISPAMASALERAFEGPVDSAGNAAYARMPFDTGIFGSDTTLSYLPSGRPGPFGPPNRALTIDVDARLKAARNDPMQRLTDTSFWTNLNTFLDRGGKIVFYHGDSDFFFSPFDTWDYWKRAEAANGDAWANASRFYMVPGMSHCSGGNAFDQIDLLTSVVDWVEKGKAPTNVIAARSSNPAQTRPQTRPMCQYPAYPHYEGGDQSDAASFTCRAPE